MTSKKDFDPQTGEFVDYEPISDDSDNESQNSCEVVAHTRQVVPLEIIEIDDEESVEPVAKKRKQEMTSEQEANENEVIQKQLKETNSKEESGSEMERKEESESGMETFKEDRPVCVVVPKRNRPVCVVVPKEKEEKEEEEEDEEDEYLQRIRQLLKPDNMFQFTHPIEAFDALRYLFGENLSATQFAEIAELSNAIFECCAKLDPLLDIEQLEVMKNWDQNRHMILQLYKDLIQKVDELKRVEESLIAIEDREDKIFLIGNSRIDRFYIADLKSTLAFRMNGRSRYAFCGTVPINLYTSESGKKTAHFLHYPVVARVIAKLMYAMYCFVDQF